MYTEIYIEYRCSRIKNKHISLNKLDYQERKPKRQETLLVTFV